MRPDPANPFALRHRRMHEAEGRGIPGRWCGFCLRMFPKPRCYPRAASPDQLRVDLIVGVCQSITKRGAAASGKALKRISSTG